jgi:hypothetical protein
MKHLILTILFALSLFAQEIGVPYVDTREAVSYSATLSPDGKTFYTHTKNTLIHWNLSPVKMLEKVNNVNAEASAKLYVTPDNKKIIFATPERGISLYDLRERKFTHTAYFPIRSGIISQANFIAVDSDRNIIIYDLDTLRVMKQTTIPKFQINCDECTDSAYALISGNDISRFILITGSRLVVLDTASLKILQEHESAFNFDNYYISINGNKLVGFDKYFDLNLYQMISLTQKEASSLKPCGYIRHPSFITDLTTLIKCGKSYSFFKNIKNELDFTLHNFGKNSWLIITPDGYFNDSAEIRKYLYMKTQLGESMPIDNVTYNKYHNKKINLKD